MLSIVVAWYAVKAHSSWDNASLTDHNPYNVRPGGHVLFSYYAQFVCFLYITLPGLHHFNEPKINLLMYAIDRVTFSQHLFTDSKKYLIVFLIMGGNDFFHFLHISIWHMA